MSSVTQSGTQGPRAVMRRQGSKEKSDASKERQRDALIGRCSIYHLPGSEAKGDVRIGKLQGVRRRKGRIAQDLGSSPTKTGNTPVYRKDSVSQGIPRSIQRGIHSRA